MKKRLMALVLTVSLITATAAACQKKEEVPKEPEVQREYTEADLKGLVEGMEERYVLEEAENIDYLKEVVQEEQVVKKVEADDSSVDYNTAGTYKVVYKVTVDEEELVKYLEEKEEQEAVAENSDETLTEDPEIKDDEKDTAAGPEESEDVPAATDNSEAKSDSEVFADNEADEEVNSEAVDEKEPANKDSADSEKADDNVTETEAEDVANNDTTDEDADAAEDELQEGEIIIEVEKEVTVVPEEEAKDLVEKGEEVWTSDSEPYVPEVEEPEEPEEEEKEEVKEEPKEEKKPESTSTSKDTSKKETSTSSSKDTSKKENTSDKDKKPAHTHTWEKVEEKGHYETKVVKEAWTETIYKTHTICSCGLDFTATGTSIDTHLAFDCTGKGNYWNEQVAVGTKEHPAETKKVWVVDQEAYYKCSSCGKKK